MCEKCVELDRNIDHYRGVASRITDDARPLVPPARRNPYAQQFFHLSRGLMFGTNGVPTMRTGAKSAAVTTTCFWAAGIDLITSGAGFDSSKLAAPTAAKPAVNPIGTFP
jgi:hypothetical protein